jgi:hypothetical protein
MNITKVFRLSIVLSVMSRALCAQDFSDAPVLLTEMTSIYGTVEWVDLDGDEDLDAILPNWVEDLKLFRNDNGTLTDVGSALPGEPFNYDNYVLVDFDADGDVDLLLSNLYTVEALLNNGNFTFSKQQTGIDLTASTSYGLKCIDVDADADLDIIANGRIFLNTNGAFAKSIVPFPEGVQNYVLGDINSDSILDFIEIGYLELIPYIGKGHAIFEKGTAFGRIRNDGNFFLLDADGDGDLDIYVSEATYSYSIFKNLYKETNTVTFERGYTFPTAPSRIAIGDINHDGLVDCVVNGSVYPAVKTFAFLNTSAAGNISFTQNDLQIDEKVTSGFSLIDFDGDSDLDLHLSSSGSSTVYGDHKIYLNEQDGPLVLPSQTPGSPATITGEETKLQWDPSPRVFYSIEVDRNTVGTLPSFSLDNGTLMRYSLEMTLATAGHKLMNLPAGEYRWRVQAIDYTFRPSAFTEYQYFTIGAAPHSLALANPDFTHVILSWSYDGLPPEAFAVYRRSSKEPWQKISEVPGLQTSFDDQTIVFDEKYEYAVRSVDGSTFSAPSTPLGYFSGQFEEKSFARKDPNIVSAVGGAGDIDADGDHDLQFVGYIYGDDEVTMKNGGMGNFQSAVVLPPTDTNNAYGGLRYFGDMDSDGDVDVCVTASSGNGMKFIVYTNTNGSFAKSYQSPAFYIPPDYEIRDFNNDGLMDFFFSTRLGSSNLPRYNFLYQTRSGDFTLEELKMGREEPFRSFKSVDINNDGFLDIFFSGSSYPYTKALLALNINGRAFKVKETEIFPHIDIHFQDLNADGLVDILYQHTESRLVIHLGSGNEQFGDPIFIRSALIYNQLKVESADLDFNGWPELIVYDNSRAGVVTNNGDLSFEVAPHKFTDKSAMKILLTDFENDGDVDIVSTGNNGQHQGLNSTLTNHWKSELRTNAPPSAPTAITSRVGKGVVKVEWMESSDNSTPVKLISYNIRIVDAAGKPWVHPGTNAAGTFRNVLQEGNAGTRTFFFVNGLPAGEYTVMVQALDASFALSPWSESHTFNIQAGPTNLTVERILLDEIRLVWTNGPANETSVLVERKTPSTDFEVIAELPPGSVEFTETGLQYNEIFTYRVREQVGEVPTAHSDPVVWNTAMWVIKDTSLPNANGAMDVGDFNGDGILDILMAGNYTEVYTTHRVKAVFKSSGVDWVRQDFGDPLRPNQPTISFEDFNRDGALDVYEYGYTDGYKTSLFKNDGTGTLSPLTNALTTGNLELLTYVDYDMDNDLDAYVLSRSNTGPSAKMIRNTGIDYEDVPDFSSLCQVGSYNCIYSMTAGDFDRDGDEDLIRHDGAFRLFLNSPEGFKSTTITFAGTVEGVFSTVDFNGDGWLDVLYLSTYNLYGTNPSRLYRNLGTNQTEGLAFEQLDTTLPAGWNSYVSSNAADFDHDGDLDLVLIGPEITYLQNNNDNTFVSRTIPRFRVFGKSKTIDYDEDGDLDIVFTGSMMEDYNSLYSQVAKVLENRLIDGGKGTKNKAPEAPANLRSYQDELGLHLEWDAPADDHTPASAVTYDVIVYKDAEAVYKNYMIPTTGERKKLTAGRTTFKALLNNMAVAEYEWKIQAVDQNYSGSIFSETGIFQMLPPPPGISDTTIYECDRTIALTAQGENIRWYSDALKTNLLATGTYSPAASQKVFVTQTMSGVEGVVKEVNITIFDRPERPNVLSGVEVNVCESNSQTIYLHAEGQSLRWYTDAALKKNVGSGPHYEAWKINGTYYVTQTIYGCQSLPSEVKMNIIVIDSRIVYEAGKIKAMEENADSYEWQRNGWFLPGESSRSVDYDGTPGSYRVLIRKGGCNKWSDPFLLTGAEEHRAPSQIMIFPNPASNQAVLTDFSGDRVSIFNSEGKQVYESDNAETEIKLNVSGWKKGAYVVVIRDGERTQVKKLVIQ